MPSTDGVAAVSALVGFVQRIADKKIKYELIYNKLTRHS